MTTTRSPFTTAAFWAGLAERSISTFAGALLAVLGGDAAGLLSVDWLSALSVAALATVVSILKAVAVPGFTAGDEDAGDVSMSEIDEMTTVTKYRPRHSAETTTHDAGAVTVYPDGSAE